MLSAFKPLNAMYSEFERLKISGRTFVRLKYGVPDRGIPFNRVLHSFEFLTVTATWIKFLEWADIKNKLNLTKIGCAMSRVSLTNGPTKIQTF